MSIVFGRWWDTSNRQDIQDVVSKLPHKDSHFMLYVNQGWQAHINKRLDTMNDGQVNAVIEKFGSDQKKSLTILTTSQPQEKVRKLQHEAIFEALMQNDKIVADTFFAGDDVGRQKQDGWVEFVKNPMRENINSFFREHKEYVASSAHGVPSAEQQKALESAYESIGVEIKRDDHPERTPCGLEGAQGK